jgi:hypothetical protein
MRCGSDELDWDEFGAVLRLLDAAANTIPESIDHNDAFRLAWTIVQVRNQWQIVASGALVILDHQLGYGNLAEGLRNHDCQDDRDRVYALLGMRPPDSRFDINPIIRRL